MPAWNKLDPSGLYAIDLIQEPSGRRYISTRPADAPPHPLAVLRSKNYTGEALRRFGDSRYVSDDVTTLDGQPFGLDPHDIWLTEAEIRYMRSEKHFADRTVGEPPWVNGLPPIFPPA